MPVARLIVAGLTLVFGGCSAAPPASEANTAKAAVEIPRATQSPVYPASHLRNLSAPAMGDLDAITARRVLRVLIARSRTHYQGDGGFRQGRTHDAAEVLQKQINSQSGNPPIAVILIETPEDRLIPDLLAGKGDAAANVLLTFARDEQVSFAAPVRGGIRELVITGPKQESLVSLEDIGGREIHARQASDHYASLVRLNEQLLKIDRRPATIVAAPDTATDEDLLEAVNNGRVPATIVDDYIFDAWKGQFANLSANRDIAVSQDGVIAWVTRKDTPKLLALLNDFFTTHRLTF
jgi:membrane-bound lytic murein transglycosylase MltF